MQRSFRPKPQIALGSHRRRARPCFLTLARLRLNMESVSRELMAMSSENVRDLVRHLGCCTVGDMCGCSRCLREEVLMPALAGPALLRTGCEMT